MPHEHAGFGLLRIDGAGERSGAPLHDASEYEHEAREGEHDIFVLGYPHNLRHVADQAR